MHNYRKCIQSVNFSHSIAKSDDDDEDDDDDDDDDEEEEGLLLSLFFSSVRSLQQVAAHEKKNFLRTYHFKKRMKRKRLQLQVRTMQ